jgi:Fe-S-cluster containining protein
MGIGTPFQTIGVRSIQHGQKNALPEENRFTCLPGCGLCCSYRVLISNRDMQRLRSTAKNHTPQIWHRDDGETALIRSSDFCILLDTDQRCSRYKHRPDYCRTYPYLWTTYEKTELDVDLSCPGLGYGETAAIPQSDKHEGQAYHQSPDSWAISHIKNFLRAQGRYASPAFLVDAGAWAIGEWRVLTSHQQHQACTLITHLFEFPRFNIEHEVDLQALKQHVSFEQLPILELLGDRALIDRNFSKPRWNTRLTANHTVELYRFWIEGYDLHIEQRNGAYMTIKVKNFKDIVWRSEARATRFAYLERWLKRQLSLRLANNLAMATPVHTAVCYLEFLLEIDWRISLLSLVLTNAAGHDVVDRAIVLEAVRGSDAHLRAWCESARLGESIEHD